MSDKEKIAKIDEWLNNLNVSNDELLKLYKNDDMLQIIGLKGLVEFKNLWSIILKRRRNELKGGVYEDKNYKLKYSQNGGIK